MDYTAVDDHTLIDRIAQADEDALSALYDRYGRLLFTVALHVVGDKNSAEEITLDVFTQVWQKANSYRADKAQVNTWLTSMARYRAIDLLRRQGSRPEQNSVRWADVSLEPVSPMGNPEPATALALQQERVRAAIAELPVEQRESLALAYFKGYSHSEIAQALNLPLGTVKTRIRLAMQKLHTLLQDELTPV